MQDWKSGGDSELARSGNAGSHRLPYVLFFVACKFCLFAILTFFLLTLSSAVSSSGPSSPSFLLAVGHLRYEVLKSSTGKFASSNLLGEGGNCSVYRGQVYGFPVAIKVRVVSKTGESGDGL